MKKCPTCQETFGDEKKFCQKDGTPLLDVVEAPPPVDPFKTMVSTQPPATSPNISDESMKTFVVSSENKEKEEDILQIPESFDPMKTMVVSDPIKYEPRATPPPSEPVVPAPEPPKFSEPSLSPPVFNDLSASEPPKDETPNPFSPPPKAEDPPIPNPFSPPPTMVETPKVEPTPPPTDSPFNQPFSPSIPTPFDKPVATPPPFNEPVATPPVFNEPEPVKLQDPQPFGSSPFDPPAASLGQPNNDPFSQPTNDPFSQPNQGDGGWNPLAPPASSGWGDQQPVASSDMSGIPPAPVGAGGPSKTLALVSLICGVLSFLMAFGALVPIVSIGCFPLSIILGLTAIITGILAKIRSSKNPELYTGGGMAIGGIITGVLAFLVLVGLIILTFVVYSNFR
jgi:hypothetical protein